MSGRPNLVQSRGWLSRFCPAIVRAGTWLFPYSTASAILGGAPWTLRNDSRTYNSAIGVLRCRQETVQNAANDCTGHDDATKNDKRPQDSQIESIPRRR